MVLLHRDVALVTASIVVTGVGSGAMFVALPYYTYASTGSVLATAAVMLAEYAPTVGMAQLAGVLVDRWDPRRVLIATDVARAGCTLAYLLHQDWWWLMLAAFVRSSLAQFAGPAAHTVVPAIAPPGRLAEVNGLNAVGGNIARLAGPALGGVLLGVGGLPVVVVLSSATFAAGAVLVACVRLPALPLPTPAVGLLQGWKEGWEAIRDHPVLRPLVAVMVLVGTGEGFVSALLAPWMTDVAGGGSVELGLMLSLQAVGGIVGGLVVLRWAHRWSSVTFLHTGALLSGALLVVIINYPLVAPVGPWPAIVLTALAGVPFAIYGTAQSIAVQEHSTDGTRGRVVSLTFGAQGVAQLLGIGVAGPLAALLGPLTINADALAYLAAGALALRVARRRVSVP